MKAPSLLLDDINATVQRVSRFVMTGSDRTLFAVADDADLAGRGTARGQRSLHGIGAVLAEADVVLARAAFVSVAFQTDTDARVRRQVGRPRGRDGATFGG